MKPTSLYGYFAFGFNYRIIKADGLLGWARADAISQLKEFLETLVELDLPVTLRIAVPIQNLVKTLEGSTEESIVSAIADSIKEDVAKLDSALDAELQLRTAYLLTKKRYPIDTLIKSPKELLATNVFDKLSDTAKRDFQLACVTIALQQPTAAAFHLMRMLEEQVKQLYLAYKKTKRLERPMWGPMTEELRKKRSPKPTDKLLDHLDSMRVHFRNPTQHPTAFYTMDEAQDLLNQTISAVNRIYAEMPSAG